MSDLLVLRALGIGDLLVAVPALRGLRRAFPRDRMVLAAPATLGELVALTGVVDELLPTPELGALRWSDPDPAVAVNLHGAGPESTADLVATRPGRLFAHRHEAFPELAGPSWVEDQPEARRWCRLLAWYGVDADPTELALTRPAVPSAAPEAVVVHPGAAFGARRWPPDRFAAVARRLREAGYRVVVTGSDAERALAERVAAGAGLPERAVLAGRLGLSDLAALVAGASLLVSNDTGIGHLATAYGTPSVVLYGPTSPARWGPPPDREQHRVLWAGQVGDPFTDEPSAGLLRLTVPDVLEATAEVLAATGARSPATDAVDQR
ncbi:glycosyltransferase family 9 protein [Actinophytocola xanthii]|uniref:Glycosyl transferase n=1 Tax=Actinophytocola xanthii TaxID=1912961 RepID=A0A1Q8C6L9_9PSEU|nr:glycosyltransferase family 9 protein [Actinophytocola xanthii]OLF09988.1 glycosyl transferase [Actinophytocola xanthii]